MLNLENKIILITGGTGSFGKNFVRYLLEKTGAKKIIVFSRDELKQSQMAHEFDDERLRFFLGDVRDLSRLQRAFSGVDIVIHAAALKQVPILEYNPFEAVKTNILGSQNVIEAGIDEKVQKVLLISTDKAVQPINLYGSTKLCAEKLFIAGNSYAAGQTKFSAVRYGNVLGSRGSIVESLLNHNGKDEVKITDEVMTRFWITLPQSFELVMFALEQMAGGEIFVPKIPSMKLVDLFDAVVPQYKRKVIGIRPGEKMHETLLTEDESRHAYELEKYYVVIPEFELGQVLQEKYKNLGKILPPRFRYTSDTNSEWLTKGQLNLLINPPNFSNEKLGGQVVINNRIIKE
ncbi:MAG: UDP-N-acetylglucosamine 4,6-dehydratase (inverting) [Candidatus Buchananbacteria bacterium RIFCSPHIGHO2_01_FULL_39_14]|uniref:UDP-N-acetylglucosamine 4,6-dehydratase (Inverting) n=1 Tax=Candidatus Buchananbacteria bacterium RIFCSPHIGHO2_01_FULL_39_14 TaxID=1797532 RepID=A0A1G1XXV7_9BACT|nr:MAG: UDP-N-acetylglucosamine 4,6-dehydratase (inverting) [Candidatus Buchananbacteria bacterium RIFCSPHIGHO2_01_FULL_39_14]OGY48650.1 MAG: UDP-N-acetylglucosamine 4,6-dehydratase (inverting) [Candidatus Buchananbacteria bacterium RIFCSPHIGHO2_02_FULL_39_17]